MECPGVKTKSLAACGLAVLTASQTGCARQRPAIGAAGSRWRRLACSGACEGRAAPGGQTGCRGIEASRLGVMVFRAAVIQSAGGGFPVPWILGT